MTPRIYTHNDLTGQVFGNWKVKGEAEGRYKHGGMLWICECQCEGKTVKIFPTLSLCNKRRPNQSCGCKSKGKLRPYEALYRKLLYESKWNRRGKECFLSYEDFLIFTEQNQCHYCLAAVGWTKFNLLNGQAYNLDRKDNDLPYTVDNCVVCCERCNKAKREFFTYEEW